MFNETNSYRYGHLTCFRGCDFDEFNYLMSDKIHASLIKIKRTDYIYYLYIITIRIELH